jgi:hypothetical protein
VNGVREPRLARKEPVAPLVPVIGECHAEAEAARGAGGLTAVVAAGGRAVAKADHPRSDPRELRSN